MLARATFSRSLRSITLTTFRDVAWNMPFYSRLGFEEIPAGDLRAELTAVVLEEAGRGLDPQERVVLRYRCGRPKSAVHH